MGSKVGWCDGVDDWWEVCGREYGTLGKQLGHMCEPGVVSSAWVLWRGVRVVGWVAGTGGCGRMFGMTIGMFN
jgi:hypothetical protein